ncbi:MAG: glycerol-3-phosphate acyltransferase [Clostridia bacterium]|jgi:glycerol-3-phosphate acyltransferase PlsY
MIALYTALGFLWGSMMFSYWLGLIVKKDIRRMGDGNPGAYNLWHAAGFKLGILGAFLDFMKGYLPLYVLVRGGHVKDMAIIPAAIGPVLGHAFSPFMKFKGGKAIAVSFGVWSAVAGFEVSLAYAIILAILQILVKFISSKKPLPVEIDAFTVVLGMGILCIYLMLGSFARQFILFAFLNLLVLIFKNKEKLYVLYEKIWANEENQVFKET